MKEKILATAADMFLNLGFKSVTMDDIANEMGISKKTIYQHFSNKTDLVETCTFHLFTIIADGINDICNANMNPIEEMFKIKSFAMKHLKDEKSSPQYQLQKYYPKIYKTLEKKQREIMITCVTENLKKGIEQGYFKSDINIDIISKFYINGMMSIKNPEIFPTQQYSIPKLTEIYLAYHVRAIASTKGLEILNQITNK